MSIRHPFGWSYPPGAENDPNAPYNQDDEGEELGEDENYEPGDTWDDENIYKEEE